MIPRSCHCHLPLAVALSLLFAATQHRLSAEENLTFNEHVRPILADNCFGCHGIDAAHRKAKLRLDTFDGATADRDGVRAIVPGKPGESEAWLRITSEHEDEVMPPPDSHERPLTAAQRAVIRQWIEEGAHYQKHWALEPIARPAVPDVPVATFAGSPVEGATRPIDAFVRAKLAKRKLDLSPEAAPEMLVRRVTLDLTGLPPTPQEIDAFLADRAPGAYERLVDRLLASPRYGEHFGRYWLDAVRYADTHGLHLDNVRVIWPYRDWVVRAFNRNQPFDAFTVEQLAGDLLPGATLEQRIASGYNRNRLSTSEAGTIEAEAEMHATADRVDTTASVFLGLTANCASCHDHKFDPLSQREYYALGAIFKGLADRVWDGNVRIAAPIAVIADTPEKQRRIEALPALVKPLEDAVKKRAEALIASGRTMLKVDGKPVSYEVTWAEDSDLPTPDTVLQPSGYGTWRSGAGVPVAGGEAALRLEGAGQRKIMFTLGDVTLAVGSEAVFGVQVNPDAARPPRAIALELIAEKKKVLRGTPWVRITI
jgi:mono/diheme cytochrome c family protein